MAITKKTNNEQIENNMTNNQRNWASFVDWLDANYVDKAKKEEVNNLMKKYIHAWEQRDIWRERKKQEYPFLNEHFANSFYWLIYQNAKGLDGKDIGGTYRGNANLIGFFPYPYEENKTFSELFYVDKQGYNSVGIIKIVESFEILFQEWKKATPLSELEVMKIKNQELKAQLKDYQNQQEKMKNLEQENYTLKLQMSRQRWRNFFGWLLESDIVEYEPETAREMATWNSSTGLAKEDRMSWEVLTPFICSLRNSFGEDGVIIIKDDDRECREWRGVSKRKEYTPLPLNYDEEKAFNEVIDNSKPWFGEKDEERTMNEAYFNILTRLYEEWKNKNKVEAREKKFSKTDRERVTRIVQLEREIIKLEKAVNKLPISQETQTEFQTRDKSIQTDLAAEQIKRWEQENNRTWCQVIVDKLWKKPN